MTQEEAPKPEHQEDATVTETEVEAAIVIEDPKIGSDAQVETESADTTSDQPQTETVEPETVIPSDDEAPAVAAVPAPQPRSSSGFLPVMIASLVAGGIGFGAAYYVLPKAADLAALETQISALSTQISEIGSVDVDSVVQAALGAALDASTRDLAQMRDQMSALATRIEQLETATVSAVVLDDAATQAAIDATMAQTDALREQLAAEQARLQELADAAAAQLEQARAAAEAEEAAAAQAARDAALRVAAAKVQSALETGLPYADDLAAVQAAAGQPLPAGLTAPAASGVATLSDLQDEFAAAARAGLAAARAAGVSGENAGTIGGFLRNTFDVRSVSPKDGADADAILSRAEEAVRQGRLTDALAEIATLPDQAQAPMADWVALAQSRVDALAAIETLTEISK